MLKTLSKGKKEFRVGNFSVEIYWPHPTVRLVKGNQCVGFWAKSILCWRADAPIHYKWAFCIAFLGFGFGFGRVPPLD